MSKYDEKASRSALYAQVKALPVNAVQRALAVDTLRNAEAVANRIVWVINGVRRLATRAGSGVGRLTHEH
jgi:hypothetical protein